METEQKAQQSLLRSVLNNMSSETAWRLQGHSVGSQRVIHFLKMDGLDLEMRKPLE